MEKFDVVVIGSGPGGYVAAVRLAQLGKKTAVVEKRSTLGGTCLNVGCIPSKALLHSSELYEQAKHEFSDHGIEIKEAKLNLKEMMKRKNKVVSEVCQGVEFLMKKNKIHCFQGFATFTDANTLEVKGNEKAPISLKAESFIIATGSEPVELPFLPIDSKRVITSDHAIGLEKVPKKMLIIGAGVIGLELGSVWRRLGAEVEMIEFLPGLFSGADGQTAKFSQRIFEKQGLKFHFNTKVKEAKVAEKSVVLKAEQNGKSLEFKGDVVLVCVGRRPYTDNLGLDKAGVEMTDKKQVLINDHFQTSTPHIYAIGDVVRGPMLAHKAEEEGIAVAEIISGQSGHVNYNALPSVVYTWPEVAWVGKGEEELKEAGVPFKVGKSFFKANGRAKAQAATDGQVKVIVHEKTDELLGIHIVGPAASELITEACVALEYSACSEDIARTFHAHPTLSEVMKDAMQAACGWAIHQ